MYNVVRDVQIIRRKQAGVLKWWIFAASGNKMNLYKHVHAAARPTEKSVHAAAVPTEVVQSDKYSRFSLKACTALSKII